jgi:gamma-butyrobetaine dioxygenase
MASRVGAARRLRVVVVTSAPDCSIVPERSADPAEVRRLVLRDGAGILSGNGPTEADARAAMAVVFGAEVVALPDAAAVREGGDKDRKPYGTAEALPLHTDGFAYGHLAPDYFGLSCVRDADAGGESVLVDSYQLLDSVHTELRDFVTSHPVDQAEEGMYPEIAPLAIVTAHGRVAVRRMPWERVAPDDADVVAASRHLSSWRDAILAQHRSARRFLLQPGDVAVIDNYRVMHARDPFEGDRFMWRVWLWTARGNGIPGGLLHSDSRYAAVDN